MINGTRFVGHARFDSGSVLTQEGSSKTIPDKLGETKKERNKKLLLEHRLTLQALPKHSRTARSGRRRPRSRGLKIVKEEDERLDRVHQTTHHVPRLSVSEADQEAVVDRDMLRRVEIVLRRNASDARRARRDRQRDRSSARRKSVIPSSSTRLWRSESEDLQPFVVMILLYSCSAFRCLMFRSNRRFKPGD